MIAGVQFIYGIFDSGSSDKHNRHTHWLELFALNYFEDVLKQILDSEADYSLS